MQPSEGLRVIPGLKGHADFCHDGAGVHVRRFLCGAGRAARSPFRWSGRVDGGDCGGQRKHGVLL